MFPNSVQRTERVGWETEIDTSSDIVWHSVRWIKWIHRRERERERRALRTHTWTSETACARVYNTGRQHTPKCDVLIFFFAVFGFFFVHAVYGAFSNRIAFLAFAMDLLFGVCVDIFILIHVLDLWVLKCAWDMAMFGWRHGFSILCASMSVSVCVWIVSVPLSPSLSLWFFVSLTLSIHILYYLTSIINLDSCCCFFHKIDEHRSNFHG